MIQTNFNDNRKQYAKLKTRKGDEKLRIKGFSSRKASAGQIKGKNGQFATLPEKSKREIMSARVQPIEKSDKEYSQGGFTYRKGTLSIDSVIDQINGIVQKRVVQLKNSNQISNSDSNGSSGIEISERLTTNPEQVDFLKED